MDDDWKLPWEGGRRCGEVRFRVTTPPLLVNAWRAAVTATNQRRRLRLEPAPGGSVRTRDVRASEVGPVRGR